MARHWGENRRSEPDGLAIFEGLHRADPPERKIPGNANAVQDADSPVIRDPPTLEGTRRARNHLKSGKAHGRSVIYAEMRKGGSRHPPVITLCVPFGTRG